MFRTVATAVLVAWPSHAWAQETDSEYESRVVGERDAQSVPSAYVTTVRVEDDVRAGATVAEALDGLPSVRIRTLGGLGAFATVSVRGSTGSQVTVVLDGIPLATSATGLANVGDVSLESLAEIRVHRGAAPPSLGGGAIGGVVELRTREPGGTPRFESTFGLGSWRTLRLSAIEVGRIERLRYSAFAGAGSSDGGFSFHDDRGTPQNTDDDRTSVRRNNDHHAVEGGLGVTTELAPAWVLSSGASLYAKDQGLPGLGAFQADHARLNTTRTLGQATLTRHFGSGSLGLRLQGRMHRDRLDDPAGEVGLGNQRSDDLTLGTAGTVLGTVPLGPGAFSFAVGGEWERYEPSDALGPPGDDGAPVRTAFVASGEYDLSLASDRVVVSPLVRLRTTKDAFSVEQTVLGPQVTTEDAPARTVVAQRIGARVRLSRAVSLRAAVGQDHREPTFEELFGDRGALVGNPELLPESAWTAEAGVAVVSRRVAPLRELRADLGVFASNARELIQLVQNSQRTAIPVNLGRSTLRGVETGVSARAPAGVSARVSYTLLDSENRSDVPSQRGKRVPGRPLHDVHAVIEERVGPLLTALDVDLVAGNFLDPANRIETPPRVLLGATVGFDAPWGLSVHCTVRNVLDHTVEEVAVRPAPPGGLAQTPQPVADYAGFPLPGRSVFLTLRYRQET